MSEIDELKSDLANDAFELMRANVEVGRLQRELARVRGERGRLFMLAIQRAQFRRSRAAIPDTLELMARRGSTWEPTPDVAAALAEHDRRFAD
jgi:hypothetical protein